MRQVIAAYPVVVITCVHYLGPPGPFSFPDSRDLLEVLGGLPWQRESPREDPLGSGRIPYRDPPSLSAKKVFREPREGPENLGRRRVPEVRDTEPN